MELREWQKPLSPEKVALLEEQFAVIAARLSSQGYEGCGVISVKPWQANRHA